MALRARGISRSKELGQFSFSYLLHLQNPITSCLSRFALLILSVLRLKNKFANQPIDIVGK